MPTRTPMPTRTTRASRPVTDGDDDGVPAAEDRTIPTPLGALMDDSTATAHVHRMTATTPTPNPPRSPPTPTAMAHAHWTTATTPTPNPPRPPLTPTATAHPLRRTATTQIPQSAGLKRYATLLTTTAMGRSTKDSMTMNTRSLVDGRTEFACSQTTSQLSLLLHRPSDVDMFSFGWGGVSYRPLGECRTHADGLRISSSKTALWSRTCPEPD